jgi:hypothetical protein
MKNSDQNRKAREGMLDTFAHWIHARQPRKRLRRFLLPLRTASLAIRLRLARSRKIENLNQYELKVYSLNGEDGIIQAILSKVGVTNKFCVEFGVGRKGNTCNSRYLKERKGWQFLWMDARNDAMEPVKNEFVTPENINSLFEKYDVPATFDLLSIDIDGNDYWVWKALDRYSPRVVVIEYKAAMGLTESRVSPYDPRFPYDPKLVGAVQRDGSGNFGANLMALAELGESKGYTLIACDDNGTNAFFVMTDLLGNNFAAKEIGEIYRKYGNKSWGSIW